MTGEPLADQAILDLTDDERAWIMEQHARASDLATEYTGRRESLPSLETLAATFAAWGQSDKVQRPEANGVGLALGTAFGQHLANGLNLRWVVVSDEQGTDFALHGQPGDILAYPISSIAKRCERQEFHCFPLLYDLLRRDIEKRREQG